MSKLPFDNRELTDESPRAGDGTVEHWRKQVFANPAAAKRFNATLAEIRDHQATLAQVRRARELTQTQLARMLDMTQSEVSKLEHRTDLLLSTLRSYIQASGGDLHVIAVYPDHDPVELLVGEPD